MNIPINNTVLPDVIELRNVSQSYDEGKSFVIKDCSLLIENQTDRWQSVVILGASGCGKSTLLKYIAGLQKPTSGEVLINEKVLTHEQRINMIFQKYSSFEWYTVLENVALGLKYQGVSKKERNEQAMEMIKIVGLEGQESKYAHPSILSGGQLQRVAIARSLLANKQILLMDEPFGALDVNSRLKMQDRMHQIFRQLQPTIILVTHAIDEAVYLGDEIYIMKANPGEIIEKIKVDLPIDRDKSIKRTSRFTELTNYIEDKMMQASI